MSKKNVPAGAGPRYAREKPAECRDCHFWKQTKKKCYLGGLDNCYYLLEAPPKEPNPCEGCEFGRQRPCVGICYRMLRIQQKGVRA